MLCTRSVILFVISFLYLQPEHSFEVDSSSCECTSWWVVLDQCAVAVLEAEVVAHVHSSVVAVLLQVLVAGSSVWDMAAVRTLVGHVLQLDAAVEDILHAADRPAARSSEPDSFLEQVHSSLGEADGFQ